MDEIQAVSSIVLRLSSFVKYYPFAVEQQP